MLMAHLADKRQVTNTNKQRVRLEMAKPQKQHHLRYNGRYPHAFYVALFACNP